MSEDEDLQKLREQRMQELQQQQAEQNQNMMAQQQAMLEAQKAMILQKILSSDARARLANIRLARPQFAQNIEMQLIQVFQNGGLRGRIPLSDDQFKALLKQLHQQSNKRERKIQFR